MIKRRGQEQSLVERRRNRYGERRNYFGISHGKDERTDLNQSRTVPVMSFPVSVQLWLIVSGTISGASTVSV